ncbi:MAG: NAD-dependent epimerase/dehydratase family protein [Candidatus Bathyarchaeia archaeon]
MVTGNLGYVGTVMTPMLNECGYDVVGLDSGFYEDCKFGEPALSVPTTKKDIRDVQTSDLKGLDAVIHLAALSNDPLSDFNPQLTYDINYTASARLAKLAKKAGVQRFLFSSSCSVYGESSSGILTEDASPNPITAYAESKLLSERAISSLADSCFTPVFLRSATAYGVSSKLRFDLVLNNLVAWAFTSGVVLLKSDGLSWRPLVHVQDMSQAFVSMLDAPKDLVHNQVFNVGAVGENYQIRDLANIVRETVFGSRVEFAKDSGPDKRSYKVDFSKLAKTLPNFKAKWDARSGALQLHDAYKRFGLVGEEFESPKFRRLEHLKELIKSNGLDGSLRWKASRENHKSGL